jgi:hypothetical protein
MHAAALLTAMVSHGLVMPPVERYDMDLQLTSMGHAWPVVHDLIKFNKGILFPKQTRTFDFPEKSRHPWADGELFKEPLPNNLGWGGVTFVVLPALENSPELKIDIIDCKGEKEAKVAFLYLRLRRIPDYARSGKFLVKASPEAFAWFVKSYGAERYSVRRTMLIW